MKIDAFSSASLLCWSLTVAAAIEKEAPEGEACASEELSMNVSPLAPRTSLMQSNMRKLKVTSVLSSETGCGLAHYKGDGYCDPVNNNPECQFDGGDCCGDEVRMDYCGDDCECKEKMCMDFCEDAPLDPFQKCSWTGACDGCDFCDGVGEADYAGCIAFAKANHGWERPGDTRVPISAAGAAQCHDVCRDEGFAYFGMECPSGSTAHCQCHDNSLLGGQKDDSYCRGLGSPLVRAHEHCVGPYDQEGFFFGDNNVGSAYRVKKDA